jgi:hypothetical protein
MSVNKVSRIALSVALGLAAMSATAAMAQGARLSDAQYIAAARCEGLMTSAALGRQDTSAIDAMLKAQSGGREYAVFDRADGAREQAQQAARHGGVYAKAALVAERDGACRSLLGAPTLAAASSAAGTSRTN